MSTAIIAPERAPRFKVGTVFIPQGRKNASACTVTDILTTRNSAGEVVAIRYVATHEFMGQTLRNQDVIETMISRGLVSEPTV
jgi:hypothetical protein